MPSPQELPRIPPPRWVISDTHFGHANILNYCPWRQTWASDVDQHDRLLIEAWNDIVGSDDWVLHLGDFAMGGAGTIADYRSQLNGRVCLVLGNHDRTATSMRSAGFDLVVRRGRLASAAGDILCIHDPAKLPDPIPDGTLQILHGHCHGKDPRGWLPAHLHPLVMDCSLDALQSIAPVTWEVVTD